MGETAKIPKGYKQTEVGVIPEDWSITLLREIGSVQTGPFGAQLHASDYSDTGTPLILIRNIIDGKISEDGIPLVSDEDALRLSKYRANAGDLIFSRVGRVGSCAIILPHQEGWLFSGQTLRIRFDIEKINPHYVACYFRREIAKQYLLKETLGTTRASINTGILNDFPIITPYLVEQNLISSNISDIDKTLESLELLIAKKRDMKQGTMQELLTGKTRLPGFNGEWSVKPLSKIIIQINDGGTPSTSVPANFGGEIPWVVIDDIQNQISQTKITLSQQGLNLCSAKLWPTGTLILSIGATIGEVGIASVPLATKQGICGIILDEEKCSYHFLKYWFMLNRHILNQMSQGSSIKEIRPDAIKKLKITIPTLKEQQAIATVLSDMDAEISALEQRRDKLMDLKQGMMQQLLTGRIRLVEA